MALFLCDLLVLINIRHSWQSADTRRRVLCVRRHPEHPKQRDAGNNLEITLGASHFYEGRVRFPIGIQMINPEAFINHIIRICMHSPSLLYCLISISIIIPKSKDQGGRLTPSATDCNWNWGLLAAIKWRFMRRVNSVLCQARAGHR